MNDATLAAFFAFDASKPSEQQLSVLGSNPALARAREGLTKTPPAQFWPSVSRAIGRALEQALHVNIADVLVGGWSQYRGLLEYADPSKHPPEEVIHVALMRRTISSSHEPRVDVLVGGRKVVEVHFAVELELAVESAILTIQDGRIKEVATGKCVGKGVLKCEGAPLIEKSSSEIPLPGRIPLGQGIPIRPVHRVGESGI